MLFSEEINSLHDDGFEGSMEEHHIFTEVFFENDSGRSSKRCFVTGVNNFECDYSEHTDVLPFTNGDNSAITSQEDSFTLKEDSRGNSGPGCLSEELTLLTRNDPDVCVKRMKLSIDQFSYAKPYLGKVLNSSATLKGVISSSPQLASHSACVTVTCRLVESSSQDVTSSCYLLKRDVEMEKGGDIGERDVSKCRLSSLDSSERKEVVASKAIASPVSQESYATKLLVASPPITATNKSGSLRCANPRWNNSCFVELDVAEMLFTRNSIKDPRPLLRYHINRLLRAAGWVIGKRKRADKRNGIGEYIYRSPEGRPIREFRRAWNSCGQSLFADGYNIVQETDGKEWTDLTQFWSDLSNTVTEIEELNNLETTTALAQWWWLLDPFANVVFIDKTIGSLKAGEVVKAKRSLVIDSYTKNAVLALKNADSAGNPFSERLAIDLPCGTSMVSDNALTVFNEDYCICKEQYGDGSFANFEQLAGGAAKALKGVSSYSFEKCMRSVDSVSGTGTKYVEISGNERSSLDSCSLPACGSDSTCNQTGTCLFEVPISSGNANISLGWFETVSPYQDSNTSSPSHDKNRSDHNERLPLSVIGDASMGSSEEGKTFDRKVPDKVRHVSHESADDRSNCTNDVLTEYPNLGRTYAQLNTRAIASDLCRLSLVEDSHLADMEALQYSRQIEKELEQSIEAPTLEKDAASFAADAMLKKKAHKRLKKISEIKLTTLYQNDELGLSTLHKAGLHDTSENSIQLELRRAQECCAANVRNDKSCKNLSLCSSQQRNDKKQSRCKKIHHVSCCSKKMVRVNSDNKHPKELNFDNSKAPLHVQSESLDSQTWRHGFKPKKHETLDDGQKQSMTCQLEDDDLLISAIIKNKSFSSTAKRSSTKRNSCKSKALRKCKSQKGSCRLLPRSLDKGGKHYMEGKWCAFGARTVLLCMIGSGVVSLNQVIQYRNPKDYAVVKDGLVTREGILCRCCDMVLSVSEFKSHAGFKLNRPCLNLFMESGKPFTLCQLEAWSAEYKARKSATRTVQVDDVDQNDDSCGLCGDGGELICCDNCPSTFHQSCLYAQELPVGNWYCPHCTCRICGDVVNDKEASKSPGALKCSQCEHKYHEACLEEKGMKIGVTSDTWFCSESCQEVYSGLHSRIGLMNLISDGLSWTLLRCIHGDQKVHSAQRFIALKAECNLKLAVALTIMEECFLPMVDPRTGIDMIPHVVYNWGSEFARLNYHGFYTVVLEKDDVLMSVASIRIHGVTVAEMPLIATCSKYRRQGMCRRLMNAIEEMLKSFKVEKLLIPAIPSAVETWTVGFGFKPLEDNEKQCLSYANLMVFPGTIWLKKPLCQNQAADQLTGSFHASPSEIDDQTKTAAFAEGGPIIEPAQQPDINICAKVTDTETEIPRGEKLQVGEDQDGGLRTQFSNVACEPEKESDAETKIQLVKKLQVGEEQNAGLRKQFSNMSCEEPALTIGQCQLEIVCHVETLEICDDKLHPLNEQSMCFNPLPLKF